MIHRADNLAHLSDALIERSIAANSAIAAIRLSEARHITVTLWRSDVVITSEQSLPERDAFEVVTASGSTVKSRTAGRDPGTNIAVLKLEQQIATGSVVSAVGQVGALAIAVGADAGGHATMRVGVINSVGPEWYSSHGGRIDRKVVLDINLAHSEEGGPVFDAAGGFLGMSTLGAHKQVLVIPALTLERIIPILLKDGRIARGWLGVALRPVAVPEALGKAAGQSSGLMVMSLIEGGPAADAGLVAGDIILSVDGASTRRVRNIAARLGGESIGRKVDLQFIRSGGLTSRQVTITEKPSA